MISGLVISDDLRVNFDDFVNSSQAKNIMEETESIIGTHAEQNSPLWVCIPQKSLTIARDFWNTNSRGWTPLHTGSHDEFFIYHNGTWLCAIKYNARLELDLTTAMTNKL